MVSKAWHAHILNTLMYMNFTQAEFNHYVPYYCYHNLKLNL